MIERWIAFGMNVFGIAGPDGSQTLSLTRFANPEDVADHHSSDSAKTRAIRPRQVDIAFPLKAHPHLCDDEAARGRGKGQIRLCEISCTVSACGCGCACG